MRKPAVVVTVAVSAVLTGGFMVATTALAEQTPARPAAPSVVRPEMPAVPPLPAVTSGLPAVPGESAVVTGRSAPATAPARRGGAAGPTKPAAGPATVPGTATKAARGHHAVTRPAPASPTPAGRPVTKPAGKPAARPVTKPATQAVTKAATKPAARPVTKAAARPAAKPAARPVEKPAAVRPARARVSTFSAAQRRVTAGQAMSTDPRGSVQQQALGLVNESRRKGGCGNLTVDRRLIVAANRHAAEMARRGYFAHEDARGRRAGDRVKDAGYRWTRYGENIARGHYSVAEVVRGWLKSPAHRENIMNCGLREVGVGLAFSSNRTPYWVQDFATPQ